MTNIFYLHAPSGTAVSCCCCCCHKQGNWPRSSFEKEGDGNWIKLIRKRWGQRVCADGYGQIHTHRDMYKRISSIKLNLNCQ